MDLETAKKLTAALKKYPDEYNKQDCSSTDD